METTAAAHLATASGTSVLSVISVVLAIVSALVAVTAFVTSYRANMRSEARKVVGTIGWEEWPVDDVVDAVNIPDLVTQGQRSLQLPVHGSPTGDRVTVRVRNQSDFPIAGVRAWSVHAESNEDLEFVGIGPVNSVVVEAGGVLVGYVDSAHQVGHSLIYEFTDMEGRSWQREYGRPLRRIKGRGLYALRKSHAQQ